MLRGALAVIVGYLAVAAWTALVLTLAWEVLGPGFAFPDGTRQVGIAWILVLYPVVFLGTVLGGVVTAILGRSPTNRPVKFLGGLVLVLWLCAATVRLMVDEPEDASAPVPPLREATEAVDPTDAVLPPWYHFTIPFVGLAGVLLGGRLRRLPEQEEVPARGSARSRRGRR